MIREYLLTAPGVLAIRVVTHPGTSGPNIVWLRWSNGYRHVQLGKTLFSLTMTPFLPVSFPHLALPCRFSRYKLPNKVCWSHNQPWSGRLAVVLGSFLPSFLLGKSILPFLPALLVVLFTWLARPVVFPLIANDVASSERATSYLVRTSNLFIDRWMGRRNYVPGC